MLPEAEDRIVANGRPCRSCGLRQCQAQVSPGPGGLQDPGRIICLGPGARPGRARRSRRWQHPAGRGALSDLRGPEMIGDTGHRSKQAVVPREAGCSREGGRPPGGKHVASLTRPSRMPLASVHLGGGCRDASLLPRTRTLHGTWRNAVSRAGSDRACQSSPISL